ncbi:hypothetical protein BsWGS_02780 [Bradybaena similaris]
MDHLADFCVVKRQVKPQNNAARERSRVKTLRSAFLDLQRSLPAVPPNTKLSKLDILVLATAYIFHLTRTLEDQDLQEASTSTSQKHPISSPSTAQTLVFHAKEAYNQQLAASASSSKGHTSLTTEHIVKHKRMSCYNELTPTRKCPLLGCSSPDGGKMSHHLHFSPATYVPSHSSLSVNQGEHPLKGTVGILHPVKVNLSL